MNRLSISLFCLVAVLLACSLPVQSIPQVITSTITPTATRQITATRTPRPTATRSADVTAARSLNVRERAGEYERVIGALYFQDIVTLTGSCAHGWAEILWNSGTAWVNADYLTKNKCSEEK